MCALPPDQASGRHGTPIAEDNANFLLGLMMRLNTAILVAILASGAAVMGAQAQYVGPMGSSQASSVKAILADPKDDQTVTLRGTLVRKTGDEEYIFSDGTGEIMVEIDDDDFPQVRVDENTRVEIHGEVDTRLRRAPEIEVDAIRVLTDAGSDSGAGAKQRGGTS